MITSQMVRRELQSQGITVVRVRQVDFSDLARGQAFFATIADRGEAYTKAKEIARTLSIKLNNRICIES